MNRARLDKYCEWGILALVLAMLVCGPLATGAFRPQDFLVVQAMAIAAGLLWLPRFWLAPSFKLAWPPVCWAVLVFLGYAVVRYFQADVEYVAREELVKILVYALVFFAVVNNFQRSSHAKAIIVVLSFLGAAISLYALYQFLSGSDRVWHFVRPAQFGGRGSGTFINPNNLAGFLGIVLPMALAMIFFGRMSHVGKVFLGYASLLMAAGIGVSLSRGGWIASILALSVFCLYLMRSRGHRLVAALVAFAVFAGAAGFLANATMARKRLQDTVVEGRVADIRLSIWQPAARLWKENLWLGVGPAHFDVRFPAYRPPEVQTRPLRVHNDYLNLLVDWGVAGFLLIGGIMGFLIAGIAKSWNAVKPSDGGASGGRSNRFALLLGGSTGLIALLLHSVVDYNVHIPGVAMVAVVVGALIAGMGGGEVRAAAGSGRLGARAAFFLILALVSFLAFQGANRFRELRLLAKADLSPRFSEEQIDFLRTAHAIEPRNPETCYKIGESYRQRSWEGEQGHEKLAREAMTWFQRGMVLNPHDPYFPLSYGMCLHWLESHDEAAPYFDRARALDPNNYYLMAHVGWHYIQVEDYARAKDCLERSLELRSWDNPIAENYLRLARRRLAEVP